MNPSDLANKSNAKNLIDLWGRQLFSILFLLTTILVHAQDFEWQEVLIEESPVGFLGMAQDKYGHIWLSDNGTGLYKYDGQNTVVYKPEPANPNSLSSGRVENLLIDREGIHWLLYFDAGLDRFDSETEEFVHFKHDDQDSTSICSNGTRDIVEDLDGNLWIGTNAGLDKFDSHTGRFIHHFSDDPDARILRSEHIRKLYVDRAGIVWIGTGSAFFGEDSEGGLFSLDPNTGEINIFRHTEEENSLVDNRVRAIFEDSREVFWVGTVGDGLHTMNREKGPFERHPFDPSNPNKLSRPAIRNNFSFGLDHITFIGEDDEGGILIGTFGNGINRYHPATGKMTHFADNESGPFKTENFSFWRFLKTHDGLLWFAPFNPRPGSTALARLDLHPNRLNFFENDATSAVAQGMDSTVYFGTNKGVQIFRNDSLKYLFKTYGRAGDSTHIVTDIKIDNGNLWATTFGAGLFKYHLDNQKLESYTSVAENLNSLSSDYLGNIVIGDAGKLYIGTAEGLDILSTKQNRYEHFELKNADLGEETNLFPKLVAIDQEHRIWIAGVGGIFRFDSIKTIFKKYELGLGAEIVTGLVTDAHGNIWISTLNHGLRRYNDANDSFESMLDETGYLTKYMNIGTLAQDANQDIWCPTRIGIIKYDTKTNRGTLFDNDWTPELNRAWDANSLSTLHNGQVIIGTESGYYEFHSSDFIVSDSIVQKPFFRHFRINNEPLDIATAADGYNSASANTSIKLPHHQNDLSFEIGYIDYRNKQASKSISYRLENYDPAWRSASSGDQVSYAQLRPGTYTFIAKAQDSHGNWGERNLSIVIRSPWHQSWWAWLIYVLILLLLLRSYIRFRSRRLSRENKILEDKVSLRTKQLQQSYDHLKSTQSQLIQAEKMASLGELTAGIAHEIQNPLNFVNNFSEINAELVDELEEELKAGKLSEALNITKNIKENEGKINHHGKRADSIIKGMLLHSRGDNGKKESTDVNALVDEYLRLVYHGLRAKDKSFAAKLITTLDKDAGMIELVRSDIGRVFLNLINNAFHSVSEKAKLMDLDSYMPTIKISSKKMSDKVVISIKDNGMGIPLDIREKIFQPFFTTKPAGQGTGLGLSLSYDIVKAHGGEIVVDSEEGQGTEFSIILPG